MKISDTLAEFKTYLVVERGFGNNTIVAYEYDLDHFFKYLRKIGIENLEDIDFEHIRLYINRAWAVTQYPPVPGKSQPLDHSIGFW